MAYTRLGDLLTEVGLITEEQLNAALTNQKKTQNRLGKELIDEGIITERQLIDALVLQLGIEYIDLSAASIDPALVDVIPKNIAKKYSIVPVRVNNNAVFIAMSDPMNFVAIEEVKSATRKRVVPMISTGESIERAISTLYGNEGATRAIEEMKREIAGGAMAGSGINNFVANDISDSDYEAAPTIRMVNSIIERAAIERASDIHIEPEEDGIRVRMRVDGYLRVMMTIPKDLQASLISRLKIMGNMDISERKIPQDGRAAVRVRDNDIDLRMSTLPTIYGEKFVIRLLDKNSQLLTKEQVGFTGEDLKKYDYLMQGKNGIILIVGPTGSGKSSTMYSMIGDLNTEQVNLITLEDPVEYNIAGINQVQINEKTGMTFAGGLRSILRQDPDIISVGEIRDGETAQIAMRAAITGHLVLSTIHTNDAVSTIDRLTDIGVEPFLVSTALNGVISQRLVRRICPNCRREYTPTDKERAELGLQPTDLRKFYRGAGCSSCFNTGYRGRVAVFEILIINSKLRAAIAKDLGREEYKKIINESGHFVTLADNARRLVFEGTTTIEEARRIINSADFEYDS